ncbi:hypothetical protein Q7Y93_10655, partial [Glaesserella parasuis]|nr:hypothetical protein [Glaesserella parasuis]
MQLQAEKQKANCSFLIKAEGIFCLYYSQIVLSFGIVDKIVAGSVKTMPLKKALARAGYRVFIAKPVSLQNLKREPKPMQKMRLISLSMG